MRSPATVRGFESHLLRHKPAETQGFCGFSLSLRDARFFASPFGDAQCCPYFDARPPLGFLSDGRIFRQNVWRDARLMPGFPKTL